MQDNNSFRKLLKIYHKIPYLALLLGGCVSIPLHRPADVDANLYEGLVPVSDTTFSIDNRKARVLVHPQVPETGTTCDANGICEHWHSFKPEIEIFFNGKGSVEDTTGTALKAVSKLCSNQSEGAPVYPIAYASERYIRLIGTCVPTADMED